MPQHLERSPPVALQCPTYWTQVMAGRLGRVMGAAAKILKFNYSGGERGGSYEAQNDQNDLQIAYIVAMAPKMAQHVLK